MKGAKTLPCIEIIKKPSISIINTMGNNQNFFLIKKKEINSLRIDINLSLLELIIK